MPISLTVAQIHKEIFKAHQRPEEVEEWFAAQGTSMQAPRNFNYDFLLTYDLVAFGGARVPKLVFYDAASRGGPSLGQVYVLSTARFHLLDDNLLERSEITIEREPEAEVIYLIASPPAQLENLRPPRGRVN
jgi:hypothetical protein